MKEEIKARAMAKGRLFKEARRRQEQETKEKKEEAQRARKAIRDGKRKAGHTFRKHSNNKCDDDHDYSFFL